MPSFDVVSEINWVEVQNGVDQTNREIGSRFDFKGSDSRVDSDQKHKKLTIYADDAFKREQVYELLIAKLGKRSVDVRCIKPKDVEKVAGNKVKQEIEVKEGIEQALAKTIVKTIKDSTLKLQASIQGESVRVTGAKKDALQGAMALLKDKITELPLQFNNFRD